MKGKSKSSRNISEASEQVTPEIPTETATPETDTTNMSTDTPATVTETPAVELTPDQVKEQVRFHSSELTRLTGERDAAVKALEEKHKAERNEVHKQYNDQIYTHDRFVQDLKRKVLADIQKQTRDKYIADMAALGVTVTDLPGVSKSPSVSIGEKRTRTSSDEIESKILEACKVEGGLGLSEIEEATSIPYTTIQKNTAEFVKEGKLKTNGLERKEKKFLTVV